MTIQQTLSAMTRDLIALNRETGLVAGLVLADLMADLMRLNVTVSIQSQVVRGDAGVA
jgi:hypothetical protein